MKRLHSLTTLTLLLCGGALFVVSRGQPLDFIQTSLAGARLAMRHCARIWKRRSGLRTGC